MRIRILPTRTHGNHVHTHEIEILDAENTSTVEVVHVQEADMPEHQVDEHEMDLRENRDRSRRTVTDMTDANVKRTYDETGRPYLEYQDLSLDRARSRMDHKMRIELLAEQNLSDLMRARNNVQSQVERAFANAISADHLGTFQGYAHRDIAINKQWNINETDAHASQMFRRAERDLNDTPEENLA